MPHRHPGIPPTFRSATSLAVCGNKKNRNNFNVPSNFLFHLQSRSHPQPASTPSQTTLPRHLHRAAPATLAKAASPSGNATNISLSNFARRLLYLNHSQPPQRSLQLPPPFAIAPVLASPKPP